MDLQHPPGPVRALRSGARPASGDHAVTHYIEYLLTDVLAEHLKSLKDFPPAQKGATLNFDEMMQSIPKGKP